MRPGEQLLLALVGGLLLAPWAFALGLAAGWLPGRRAERARERRALALLFGGMPGGRDNRTAWANAFAAVGRRAAARFEAAARARIRDEWQRGVRRL